MSKYTFQTLWPVRTSLRSTRFEVMMRDKWPCFSEIRAGALAWRNTFANSIVHVSTKKHTKKTYYFLPYQTPKSTKWQIWKVVLLSSRLPAPRFFGVAISWFLSVTQRLEFTSPWHNEVWNALRIVRCERQVQRYVYTYKKKKKKDCVETWSHCVFKPT